MTHSWLASAWRPRLRLRSSAPLQASELPARLRGRLGASLLGAALKDIGQEGGGDGSGGRQQHQREEAPPAELRREGSGRERRGGRGGQQEEEPVQQREVREVRDGRRGGGRSRR